MDIVEFFNTYWSTAEAALVTLSISLTLFIFFHDPVRRWKFLGFRPTAVLSIFDPKTKKILLVKGKEWFLPQGGIYESDIYTTVEQTIQRELGISSENYKLEFVKPIGTIKIGDKERLKRATIGTITLFPYTRGKGYLACFIKADLPKVKRKIKPGYDIHKVETASFKAAIKLIQSRTDTTRRPKQRLLVGIINETASNFFNS